MQTSFQTSANSWVSCTQHSRTLVLAPNLLQLSLQIPSQRGGSRGGGKGRGWVEKCGREKPTRTQEDRHNLRTSSDIKYVWNEMFHFYVISSFKPSIFSFRVHFILKVCKSENKDAKENSTSKSCSPQHKLLPAVRLRCHSTASTRSSSHLKHTTHERRVCNQPLQLAHLSANNIPAPHPGCSPVLGWAWAWNISHWRLCASLTEAAGTAAAAAVHEARDSNVTKNSLTSLPLSNRTIGSLPYKCQKPHW